MCKNTFVKTESQFNDLMELFTDMYKDTHTHAEIHNMVLDYVTYFNADRKTRTAHANLSTPCQFSMNKDGSIKSNSAQKSWARKNLENLLGMAKPYGARWHVAHLCENSTSATHICTNPEHLYFATPKENHQDVDRLGRKTGVQKTIEYNQKNKTGAFHDPELRAIAQSMGGKVGSIRQFAEGTHNTINRNRQCRYCYSMHSAIQINRHELSCAKKLGLSEHTPRPTRTNKNPQPIKLDR